MWLRRGGFTVLYVLALFVPGAMHMENLIDWLGMWWIGVSVTYAGLMIGFAGRASKTALSVVFLVTIVFPIGLLTLLVRSSDVTLAMTEKKMLRYLSETPDFWWHVLGLFWPLLGAGLVVGVFQWRTVIRGQRDNPVAAMKP
ncbi:hypothetical protein GCM10010971_22340 [Silvimonas amylolytica]|uniref:ABC transporter permease n=2 Tax=Silvimonas amylolytica TaxID=449663 RepID=A0ABQ2PMG3_9NEIS|nr:hypothetical protein GCM10010971_22340 [Silvimonas amylolytica]